MRFSKVTFHPLYLSSNKTVYRNQIEKEMAKKLKVKWRQRYSFGYFYGLIV
jgi:L-rhamnose isomerase